MKAPLLYLSLFGLVWAQSELQPHYKKVKQKCTGEHQITVKGRNAKHGYYIFQYVYSSLMPNNQTWIKKEEDDNKTIYSGQHESDKEKRPRNPVDNHTAEEKEEGHKNVVEMGNERESEDRRTSERVQNWNEHNENPSNRDLHQKHSEYILDKGRNHTAIDDTADDADGSGDMGFLGQEERPHGTISGNEDQSQGKGHQDARDTETNSLWRRNEVGLSGISNGTKLSKRIYIKIKVKENEATEIQEIPHSSIPKKSKDSKSKDYLGVSMKIKNTTSKEKGGSIDLLDKGKEKNASARLQTHVNANGKISGDLLRKMDHLRNGRNYTSFSDTDEILTMNEKSINYTRAHKKEISGDLLRKMDHLRNGRNYTSFSDTDENLTVNEKSINYTRAHKKEISGDLLRKMDHLRNGRNYTSFSDTDEILTVNEKSINYTRAHKKEGGDVLNQKLDGPKVIYGEPKPHQKGEVRDNITSSKQIEVADVIKSPRKDRVKDDTINGRSNSHIDIASISKIHRTGEGELFTGRSISQVENSVFTQPGQTNQSRILSGGKMNGSGVTKSHAKSKDDVTLLGGASVSQGSGSGAINQSQKGTSRVGTIHGKFNNGAEGFHFTKAHPNKADSRGKINAHGGKQSDPEKQEKGNHRGLTFQEGKEEVVKGNIGYHKDHRVDSSGRKKGNSKHKSVGIKSALTLPHGSHIHKHIAKSQEHSSYTLKNSRKLTEPRKKSSRAYNGRRSSGTAQQDHGHLGVLQRKSSRREKKSKSRKNIHASDSSQSSESVENSRYDSRQSYEDYQNDHPDSFQSAESAEENRSAGSNQRDDCSHMEDASSHEDSREHRRN